MNPAKSIVKMILRLATFILMAITILAACSGFVPPMIWSLPAVFMLFFPYLLILLGVVSVIWLCFGAWITSGLGVVAIIASMQIAPHAFPTSFSKTPASNAKTFTLLTYNICHGNNVKGDSAGLSRSLSYLIESKPDIVLLQEFNGLNNREVVDGSTEQFDSLRKIYPYILEGRNVFMTMLSKYPAVEMHRYPASTDQLVSYLVNIGGKKVEILSSHLASYRLTPEERDVVSDLKSGSRSRQGVSELRGSIFHKLGEAFRTRTLDAELVRQIVERGYPDMIVCGDFNDVADSWAYRRILGVGLRDATSETTFGYLPSFNDNYFFFRIDHVLYRGDMRAIELKRPKVVASDHYPLLVTFEFTPKRAK